MIIQIYEIQTPREAEECIRAGVDHIGSVILSETDWKQPETREVTRATKGTAAKNSIIPLFQDIETLFRIIDYYRPHFLHFCESLFEEYRVDPQLEKFVRIQRQIGEYFPSVGIIRSIPIPADDIHPDFPTLPIAERLEPLSDFFLTDTWLGNEPVKGFIGITGRRCMTAPAKALVDKSRIPVILAGGLSPENVYSAVSEIRPAGADSCTLTNELDDNHKPIRFKKDFSKVTQFVKEVRRAESSFYESGFRPGLLS